MEMEIINKKNCEHNESETDTRNGCEKINAKWKILLTEENIQHYVKKCAEFINIKFRGKDVVVACILKGAVYFFVDFTRYLTIPHSCYFIEASSYHDSQKQSEQISIMGSIEPSKFEKKHVILVDELFDNGHTMHEIKNAIHEKAHVPLDMIFTCTAFIKNKPPKYEPPNLFGVIVPNVWLVGYGLDDKQKNRNLKFLCGCPKSEGVTETEDDKMFVDDKYYDSWRSFLSTK